MSDKKEQYPPGYLTCPVRRALSMISGKWIILIIYELSHSPKRFNALKRDVNGISQRLLTTQLRAMEENGLVKRKVVEISPPHVEYSLTKKGLSLMPIIREMELWGDAEIANDQQATQQNTEK